MQSSPAGGEKRGRSQAEKPTNVQGFFIAGVDQVDPKETFRLPCDGVFAFFVLKVGPGGLSSYAASTLRICEILASVVPSHVGTDKLMGFLLKRNPPKYQYANENKTLALLEHSSQPRKKKKMKVTASDELEPGVESDTAPAVHVRTHTHAHVRPIAPFATHTTYVSCKPPRASEPEWEKESG